MKFYRVQKSYIEDNGYPLVNASIGSATKSGVYASFGMLGFGLTLNRPVIPDRLTWRASFALTTRGLQRSVLWPDND